MKISAFYIQPLLSYWQKSEHLYSSATKTRKTMVLHAMSQLQKKITKSKNNNNEYELFTTFYVAYLMKKCNNCLFLYSMI